MFNWFQIDFQLILIYFQLISIDFQLSSIYFQLSSIDFQLISIYFQLISIDFQLISTYFQLIFNWLISSESKLKSTKINWYQWKQNLNQLKINWK